MKLEEALFLTESADLVRQDKLAEATGVLVAEITMGDRCFWCNVYPDAAADRHEGPHLKWCIHYREPPLPAGVQRVKVGSVTMVVMVDPLMPADEIRMSCGPRPEQNVRVTGLARNTSQNPAE